MAGRIRSIKPEVHDDDDATALSDAAWRLWVGSWVLADDHGNVRASNKYLAAEIWKDTSKDVSSCLQELIDTGFFLPYAVRGQRYVHISGWEKHQRIDNAGKARVPLPEEDDSTWSEQPTGFFAYRRGDPRRTADTRASRGHAGEQPHTADVEETNQPLTADSAEYLGESPREPSTVGELPLRAHARARGPAARPPISTTERDHEGESARPQSAETKPGDTMTALSAEFSLSPERRAYAATIGLTDIDAVFTNFQNTCAERAKVSADWDATWRKFCDRELQFQKKDRLRRGNRGAADGGPPPPAHRRLDLE